MTRQYISTCINNRTTDPLCPIFSVKSILEEAEKDKNERLIMLQKVKINKAFHLVYVLCFKLV